MNHKEYQAAAVRTESVPAKINVGEIPLHALLVSMIATTQLANDFKRTIFYGKDLDSAAVAAVADSISGLFAFISAAAKQGDLQKSVFEMKMEGKVSLPPELLTLDKDNIDIRLLHAGFGIFTESGEILEHVFAAYENGVQHIDEVGFGEEIADVAWYQAIAVDTLGLDMDKLLEANIAKLKARFPEKFDAALAINRDTDAERAVLESHHASDVVPRGSLGEEITA